MTANDFLEAVKVFTTGVVGDIILPCYPVKGDSGPCHRAPAVYKQKLPDMYDFEKKTPYIIHQVVSTASGQSPGERTKSRLVLRSVFCIYHPQSDEGALALLELMERFRIGILKTRILDSRYEIDLEKSQLETLMYPEESDPFFAGEMVSEWKMPSVEREDIRRIIS